MNDDISGAEFSGKPFDIFYEFIKEIFPLVFVLLFNMIEHNDSMFHGILPVAIRNIGKTFCGSFEPPPMGVEEEEFHFSENKHSVIHSPDGDELEEVSSCFLLHPLL